MINDKNAYIMYLCNHIKEEIDGIKIYAIEEDYRQIKEYNEPYKYHLEVLPQPYYGNITNPKVLFLAKNPSYEDGKHRNEYKKNNDNTDTSAFENNPGISIENYIKGLENVDFFLPEGENKYFVNCAWHWWHKNVIGENCNIKLDKKQIGYINLNPYHSRSYNDVKFNYVESQNELKKQLKETLQSVDLIIIVWGKTIWDKFVSSDSELKRIYDGKTKIVLNRFKVPNKKGYFYGRNITPLSKLLCSNDSFDDKEQNENYNASLEKARKIFKNEE